ncbi:MAG: threonine-phosphate decarboxylase CobD [Neomegalonema sp.]
MRPMDTLSSLDGGEERPKPRDHGGDLDRAIAKFGGAAETWIDLSTGINPVPYPIGAIPSDCWTRLPAAAAMSELLRAAREAYGVPASVSIVAAPGAQALIQLTPRLRAPGAVAIVSPTYNEHSAAFAVERWRVEAVSELGQGGDCDAAVIVNPNNPDGRLWPHEAINEVAQQVGLLVIDESFADPMPGASMAADPPPGAVLLRSFGKFYGLAGLRLGFAIGRELDVSRLRSMLGPWAVSGPAIAIATRALSAKDWAAAAIQRLDRDAARLDAMAVRNGWRLAGGTALFRTYETRNAIEAQETLAAHQIWSRIFPYSQTWLRLGLPGQEAHWARLERALT